MGGGSFNFTSACIFLPQAIYIIHCILDSISNEKILKQFVEKNPRILDYGDSFLDKCYFKVLIKFYTELLMLNKEKVRAEEEQKGCQQEILDITLEKLR